MKLLQWRVKDIQCPYILDLGFGPYVVFLVEYNGGFAIAIEFYFGLFRLLHLISMWKSATSGFEA